MIRNKILLINKIIDKDIPLHLLTVGKEIRDGWRSYAARHGLEIGIEGIDPLLHFYFKHEHPDILKTLFTQNLLERGFLAANSFYASYAHKGHHVKAYLEAVNSSFGSIAAMVRKGNPERYLKSVVCESGFKRTT